MPRFIWIAIAGAILFASAAWPAGDLTRQEPIDIKVDLGGQGSGQYAFHPNSIRLETGKLYKLVLHNPSQEPHYFSSPQLAALVFTRKVQVMDRPGGKAIGEIKGVIREIEVYPGGTVEWFFVPVATGLAGDLHCPIMAPDGKTHAAHGMVGTVEVH
jgi:uncharacterized cupredoxin-like copper-binding protein